MSVRPSVRMEHLGSHWTDFHEIWYLSIYWKSVLKLQVSLISGKNNRYCAWRPIYISYRSFSVSMRNVRDRSYRENQNTHFVFSNCFFSENRAVYEIMWKNIVERGKPQVAIWRMRFACWIMKATNTHSEYVILIAFRLQQWLHKRASILHYTYTGWLVFYVCGTRSLAVGEVCQRDAGENVWVYQGGIVRRLEENAYRGGSWFVLPIMY